MKNLFKWLLSFFKKDKGLEHIKKIINMVDEKYPLTPTLSIENKEVNKIRKELNVLEKEKDNIKELIKPILYVSAF